MKTANIRLIIKKTKQASKSHKDFSTEIRQTFQEKKSPLHSSSHLIQQNFNPGAARGVLNYLPDLIQ